MVSTCMPRGFGWCLHRHVPRADCAARGSRRPGAVRAGHPSDRAPRSPRRARDGAGPDEGRNRCSSVAVVIRGHHQSSSVAIISRRHQSTSSVVIGEALTSRHQSSSVVIRGDLTSRPVALAFAFAPTVPFPATFSFPSSTAATAASLSLSARWHVRASRSRMRLIPPA